MILMFLENHFIDCYLEVAPRAFPGTDHLFLWRDEMKNDTMLPDTPFFTERELMERRELFSKHKVKKIKHDCPPGFRWECRKDGKRYRFTDNHYKDMIDFLQMSGDYSLSDIFDDFIEYSVSVLDLKPGTVRNYRDAWTKYISVSKLATLPVKSIKRSDIDEFFCFVKQAHNGVKKKYWDNIKGTLSVCYEYLQTVKDLESDNPFKSYKPKGKNPFLETEKIDSKNRWFSDPYERKIVIQALYRKSVELQDPRYLGLVFLFFTGLRVGELVGLKWSDVQDGYLSIHRQVIKSGNTEILVDHCKTSSSVRRLKLTKESIDLLKKVKMMYQIKGISSDFIFLDLDGDRCKRHQLDKKLRKVQTHLGIDEIKSCHDIRRTYINVLYRNGVLVKEIQKLVGHSTLSQTLEYICEDETSDETYDLVEKALVY